MDPSIQTTFSQAITLFQEGNLVRAEKVLKDLVVAAPKEIQVIHLLAIVLASQERHLDAISYYSHASNLNQQDEHILSNWASSLNALGRNLEALKIFHRVLEINPGVPEFWYNTGNVLSDLGRLSESVNHYREAVKLNPQHYQAFNNLGKALFDMDQYDEAIGCYEKSLKINPTFLDCLVNKGALLDKIRRHDEAAFQFDMVLDIKPEHFGALINKGLTLHELKRYDEALFYYDKALNLDPNYAEGWSNKGVTLHKLKRYDEALFYYDKALNLDPNYAEGWSNKGVTLGELMRYDEALFHYEKALALKPDIDWTLGDLIYLKMRICAWSNLDRYSKDIAQKVIAQKKVIQPFPLMSLIDDPALHKKSAEIYTDAKYPINFSLGHIPKYERKNKLRIGYYSPDFRSHAVSFLTSELFEIHNRDQFEIFAFSLQKSSDYDEVSGRLRKAFDRFVDAEGMSDLEIARLSRKLEIDIAIDLSGLTKHSRTGIFSYRAAPIQVNWLGYPGTIGAEYFDYIVADKTLIPESHQCFYAEKVISLPDTYMVDDTSRTPSARVFTREECGLPADSFVFCCFNNDYKFNSRILDGWSRILKAVEKSVIWISENNAYFKFNIATEFEKRGINSSRIIFAKRLELMGDHLARYSLANLFLDTTPYNAHTTALDSLKAGVPVLVQLGQSFQSRVSASLVNAIGLPELVTSTQSDYEALAIDLAVNPEKIKMIKEKLLKNNFTEPLFNTPKFTKNLETAYLKIYERYHADLEPDHIFVT